MNWVQRKIYLYNVTFGLYMLDWWERCLFNILVVVLMWFICYNGVRSANEFYKRCINRLCELWLEICSFECRTHFKGVFIGLMVGASSQLPSIFNFHIVWLPITGFYGDFKSHMNLESSGLL